MFRKVKEAISHQVRNILESQSLISKQQKLYGRVWNVHSTISKTTKNLSLLDTFHHFSAVQQAHKITQVESTRKWTSGITDNIIISSNYRLNTKRIFSISTCCATTATSLLL